MKMKKNKSRVGYKDGTLVGGQKKLDKNKDGQISGKDFELMKKGGRVGKKVGGRIGKMGGGMMMMKRKPLKKGGKAK